MFAILIVPILICGIIWIKSHPSESLKIGTFQGWLVYLYAIKYGFYFVTAVYMSSDFLIPYLFKSETFTSSISAIGLLNKLHADVETSDIHELSLLNILSIFILHSTTPDITTFPSGAKEAFLTSKLVALSLTSFLLSLLIGCTTVIYNRTFGLYNKKVAKIYQEKSPSDYLLMKITDNFIDEIITDNKRLKKIKKYNKETFSFTPRRYLRAKIISFVIINNISRIITSPLLLSKKLEKKIRVPIEYRSFSKMYRMWLKYDRSEYLKLESQTLDPNKRKFSLISMNSRKIYVGVPITTGKPDEEGVENKEVLILPYFSGYRKESNMGIDITNRYLIEHGDHLDIDLISLPKSEIASISAFSIDMHAKVNRNMKKTTKSSYEKRPHLRYKKRNTKNTFQSSS